MLVLRILGVIVIAAIVTVLVLAGGFALWCLNEKTPTENDTKTINTNENDLHD